MSPLLVAVVAHLLATTPQIQRLRSAPAPNGSAYYRLSGTGIAGFVVPSLVDEGRLRNGRELLVVPLDSGGSGQVFGALVWTRAAGEPWRFAGSVPSPNGRLAIRIEGGVLVAALPEYGPGDPDCCPSRHRYERFTLDGRKLELLAAYTAK